MNGKKVIRAKDVMNNDFILIDGISTVQDGIDKLKQSNAHTLFIDRRHDNDEYGIVVLADIAKKILAVDKAPERVNLYEIMTKPVLQINPDMDIRYVARIFDQFGLSTSPVVENHKIIGVITYNEMVLHRL